jgi:hypothetical protein
MACPSVEIERAELDNPYTLREVRYNFAVPADQEWPVRLSDLWLYVRFFNGIGTREFTIQVDWFDRKEEVCEFLDIRVVFPHQLSVHSRVWRLNNVRYPGPGRYRFRLRGGTSRKVLATEYINLEKNP